MARKNQFISEAQEKQIEKQENIEKKKREFTDRLTEDEKVSYEAMNDEEKKAFRAEKRKVWKVDDFKKLASPRVTKALASMDIVGNLANKNNYTYTDNQANAIIDALKDKVAELEVMFAAPIKNEETGFTFVIPDE